MTDEEMSEFAECMADACRRSRLRVTATMGGTRCCPLGALFGGTVDPDGHTILRLPTTYDLIHVLPAEVTRGFLAGFDGMSPAGDMRAFELGRAFAELYP